MANQPFKDDRDGDAATKIMRRMVRMPPKPHSEMKIGKRKAKASTKANSTKKATEQ